MDNLTLPRIFIAITERQNIRMRATTVDYSLSNIVDAVIVDRDTQQAVNGSLCHLTNLEVYRGREQAYDIRHDGFSLNSDGNIEVITYPIIMIDSITIIHLLLDQYNQHGIQS